MDDASLKLSDKTAMDRALREVGERMGQSREDQKITQSAVARRIGRKKPGAYSAISRWESGAIPPTLRDLLLYAEAVNKPASFFLDGVVTKTTEQLTNGLDHESEAQVVTLAEFLKTRRPA